MRRSAHGLETPGTRWWELAACRGQAPDMDWYADHVDIRFHRPSWFGKMDGTARRADAERSLTRLPASTGRGLAMQATRTCSIEGCERPAKARTWCNTHYERWRRHGDPLMILPFNPRIVHGKWNAPEWRTWAHMKERCLNPNNHAYARYGGRGITIYRPWVDSFEAFFAHVGPKPGPEYSLDRIDNDGNYEPGNVRWATPREQGANRLSPNRLKTHCPAGHPYDEHNTYFNPRGWRRCRACLVAKRERRRSDRESEVV